MIYDKPTAVLSWRHVMLRFNNKKTRGLVYQVLTVAIVGIATWWVISNTVTNLARSNTVSGYGFLTGRAGFEIGQTLIPYSGDSTYGRALLVGFLNTVLIAVTGIVTATVLGFIVATGRQSSNWLISRLGALYVEIFRNTPALLVIFVWYSGVLSLLPQPKDSIALPLGILLNNRGLAVPAPLWEPEAWLLLATLFVSLFLSLFVSSWSKWRQASTGRQFPTTRISVALVVGLPAVVFFAAGTPVSFDFPTATRFNLNGGYTLAPEFVALYLALSMYTAAFVAEIIRAGINGVPSGQSEAAIALGLRPAVTRRLVVLPQALRIIIPPLTSQYLNLTKNSSLGLAIGFPELVSTGGTVMNQTGQAMEIVSIWLIIFLTTSIFTSACMNAINRKTALLER